MNDLFRREALKIASVIALRFGGVHFADGIKS